MLEWECLTLDKNITDCISEDTYTTCKRNTLFGQYVSRWQNFKKKEKGCLRRASKLSDILYRKRKKGTGVDSNQTQVEAPSNLDTMCDI